MFLHSMWNKRCLDFFDVTLIRMHFLVISTSLASKTVSVSINVLLNKDKGADICTRKIPRKFKTIAKRSEKADSISHKRVKFFPPAIFMTSVKPIFINTFFPIPMFPFSVLTFLSLNAAFNYNYVSFSSTNNPWVIGIKNLFLEFNT